MGPNNPWSPEWRPDESGIRFRRIFIARRGAAAAGVLWIPVALVATWQARMPAEAMVLVVIAGSAGVALLGAGLANAAVGSRIDAIAVGVAMAIGAPVASVTSLVIAGFFLDFASDRVTDAPSAIVRGGVLAALGVAPLVVLAVSGWLVIVRRYAARLGVKE
jgi:hypothetical protein